MMGDVVLRADGVSKKFCRTLKHTMLYGSTDIARSFFGLNGRSQRLRGGEFWAVDDISFELKRGEVLGMIGSNGAGKTTILKMLNGIFMPDKGRVEVNGRMGALISVGAGFHPMLTGRENVYINGSILGMTKREIDRKFDEIVDFSEVGEFIDSPVKHYSSGMFVRLGFAVASHCEPEILLVDEILSVGDLAFRQKCVERMREYVKNGGTVILVSHSMAAISGISKKVLWLEEGKQVEFGDSEDVIGRYIDFMNKKATVGNKSGEGQIRWGSGEIRFTDIKLMDGDGNERREFSVKDTLIIQCEYKVDKTVPGVRIWLTIRDTLTDVPVTAIRMRAMDFEASDGARGKVSFTLDLRYLRPRRYNLLGGMVSSDFLTVYDRWQFADFVVSREEEVDTDYVPGQNDLVNLPINVHNEIYESAKN